MSTTIESFVERIKQDGIDAGQKEAERIIAAAQSQSQEILAATEASTRKLLLDAEKQVQRLQEQVKSELALAARDIEARLRDRLQKSMAALLQHAARTALVDPHVLAQALAEMARSQVTGSITISNAEQIKDLALNLLGKQTPELPSIRLADGRTEPGFHFRLDQGGVVELDPNSVTEHLMSLCGPVVSEILKKAA